MPRAPRAAVGGRIYHVLNRAAGRRRIFETDADHWAFQELLSDAVARTGTRLIAYCVMPNHWHLIAWPREDGELSRFVSWLTQVHAQRWHAHRGTVGTGHLYQGRFKSFVIKDDGHLLTACRYVERNALSAGLVARAEDWPWGSLHHRLGRACVPSPELSSDAIALPSTWTEHVNRPLHAGEVAAIRRCIDRGRPYGDPAWAERVAAELGITSTLRSRGRPTKEGLREKGV